MRPAVFTSTVAITYSRLTVRGALSIATALAVLIGTAGLVVLWFDRSDDYQLRFLRSHPLAQEHLRGAELIVAVDRDVSGSFMESSPASDTGLWRRRGGFDEMLRELDRRAAPTAVVNGIRCRIESDGDRGGAVFFWTTVGRDVELTGGYTSDPPAAADCRHRLPVG